MKGGMKMFLFNTMNHKFNRINYSNDHIVTYLRAIGEGSKIFVF